MIVPSKKLIYLTAGVLTPLLGVIVIFGGAVWGAGTAAIYILLVFIDAARAVGSLRAIEVEAPGQLRLVKERESVVPIEISHKGQRNLPLRLAVDLPPVFEAPSDHLLCTIPADDRKHRIEWRCIPLKRGEFDYCSLGIETHSALGLWLVRRRLPLAVTLRVYPDVGREYRATTLLMRGNLEGARIFRRIGKGREFEQLREYQPGDTYSDIHWKTSAKRCHPITKTYRTERTQEIYVLIDASRLSARSVIDPARRERTVSLLERYINAALMLALAAERQGDLFGCIVFSERVDRVIPAGRGRAHFNTVRNALFSLDAEPVSPDFMDVATFIRTRFRKRALLLFLTSLDDPLLAEQFIRSTEIICRHHLVVADVLTPTRAQPVFAGETIKSVEEIYERLAGHTFWQRLRDTARLLHARHVHMQQLDNERLSADLISQYMNIKQRQIL